MRYRLRTLLIVLALAPPALANGWCWYSEWRAGQRLLEEMRDPFFGGGSFPGPDLDLPFDQNAVGGFSCF